MTTEFPPPDKPHAGYLLKLQLENIRCFAAKQTLDLCAPGTTDRPARWTIILGENGTGKTTLLQALFNMSPRWDGDEYILPHFISESAFKGFLRRVDLLAEASLDFKCYSSYGLYKKFRWACGCEDGRNYLHGRGPKGVQDPILIISYGANRRITAMQNYQAIQGYETLFLDEYGLRSPADWFSAALGATFGQGVEVYQRVEARYARLLEQLPALLPDVQSVRASNKSGTLELLFTTDYGEVTIEQLSAGYRAMAAWVVDLAAHMFNAYPDSDDPLSEPAVVLVDEFDLHLHPRWQREAVGFLTERFPAVQFIVTAHSPLVVQSAPDANIVVLKKVGDHVEIENNPVSVKTWRVDQILSSELFGLESARPPEVDAKRKRLEALLLMDARTPEQEAELERLDAELDEIAIGYDAEHIEALDFLKRVADELKGDKEP